MQIGHANPELLGPAGLARTNAASSAGTVRASTPTSSDPPPMGSNQTLDMDAFMSAWGSSDQTWDVDGSGMVDGTDLGTLLSVQSAADAGDADLQALLGAWGSSDPDWDFNADGIVDGLDLGVYLEGGVGDSPPASEALTVDGFVAAWGSADPTYDLNADGIVDGQDLGQYLEQQMDSTVDPNQLEQFMSAWGSDDATFDLNADGTVDGLDLGLFLEQAQGTQLPSNALPMKVEHVVSQIVDQAMSRFDDAGEGRIALSDVGLPMDMARLFDADGDAFLDRSEFSQMISQDAKALYDGTDASIANLSQRWNDILAPDPIQRANQSHAASRIEAAPPMPGGQPFETASATERVADILSSLGHESLPSNLSDVLKGLKLPGTSSEAIMDRLMQEHGFSAVDATA
jgi:Ca2+-binding EF-hand superfamily protein